MKIQSSLTSSPQRWTRSITWPNRTCLKVNRVCFRRLRSKPKLIRDTGSMIPSIARKTRSLLRWRALQNIKHLCRMFRTLQSSKCPICTLRILMTSISWKKTKCILPPQIKLNSSPLLNINLCFKIPLLKHRWGSEARTNVNTTLHQELSFKLQTWRTKIRARWRLVTSLLVRLPKSLSLFRMMIIFST